VPLVVNCYCTKKRAPQMGVCQRVSSTHCALEWCRMECWWLPRWDNHQQHHWKGIQLRWQQQHADEVSTVGSPHWVSGEGITGPTVCVLLTTEEFK